MTFIIYCSLGSYKMDHFTSYTSLLLSLCIQCSLLKFLTLNLIVEMCIILVELLQKYACSQFSKLLSIFCSDIIAICARQEKLALWQAQLVQGVTIKESLPKLAFLITFLFKPCVYVRLNAIIISLSLSLSFEFRIKFVLFESGTVMVITKQYRQKYQAFSANIFFSTFYSFLID